ncbi:nuclear transport factor 2 family protein [Blastococcus sp. SYSU DS0619]
MTVGDAASPGQGGPGAADVIAGLEDMYDAFMAGDRQRFDRHLADDVTTWESGLPGLLSRSQLDAHRDDPERPTGGKPRGLRVEPVRVDVWGDVAAARYELVVLPPDPDGAEETTRVTDLLRRTGDGWRIVHHHAEVLPGLRGTGGTS